MDTAPFATKGDGAIGIDRSQLERYIAGLDPKSAGSGPKAPLPLGSGRKLREMGEDVLGKRDQVASAIPSGKLDVPPQLLQDAHEV